MDLTSECVYVIRDNNGHLYTATLNPDKAIELQKGIQETVEYQGSNSIVSITTLNIVK